MGWRKLLSAQLLPPALIPGFQRHLHRPSPDPPLTPDGYDVDGNLRPRSIYVWSWMLAASGPDREYRKKGGAHRHTPCSWRDWRYLFFAAFFLPPLAFFAIA